MSRSPRKIREDAEEARKIREVDRMNESGDFGNTVFQYNQYTKKITSYDGSIRNKDRSKDDRFLGWL